MPKVTKLRKAEREAFEADVAAHEPVGNPSGLKPVEYKIVVRPDDAYRNEAVTEGGVKLRKTDGGILIPQDAEEREQAAMARGTLLEVGGNAFSDWDGDKPAPGDKVMFGRYTGQIFEGVDGEEYRILLDKDIAAIWTE